MVAHIEVEDIVSFVASTTPHFRRDSASFIQNERFSRMRFETEQVHANGDVVDQRVGIVLLKLKWIRTCRSWRTNLFASIERIKVEHIRLGLPPQISEFCFKSNKLSTPK